MATSWARSGRPDGTIVAPGATSSSPRTIPSPGATGRTTSIVPGTASCVCSIITTASAPLGSIPPVGTAIAVSELTCRLAAAPILTAPVIRR